MKSLDHSAPAIFANLAMDEALLLAAEAGQGGEALRFWEQPSLAVVLGASGTLTDDVEQEACRRDGVAIARRASGGGTVLLGPGCLCFSLVLDMDKRPELRSVSGSYRTIVGSIAGALAPVVLAGSSDLALGPMKVSGNAQKRGRRFLVHHGTLLYAFDLLLIGKYLKQPLRQPEYRQGRPHWEFVANLPFLAAEMKERLALAWEAAGVAAPPDPALVARLVDDRYAAPAWIERR